MATRSVQLLSFDPFAVLCDGRGLPFADARVLQHLRRMTLVAAVLDRPDDPRALAALRALELRAGFQHDVVFGAAAAGPDEVRRKAGVPAEAWLHVSAAPAREPWIPAARAAGARIVCMPRQGIEDPLAMQTAAAAGELELVSDLWQLANAVARDGGGPVRYEVRATATTPEVLERFAHWMRYEHGADLLGIRGCQHFDVLREGEHTLRNEYLFRNQAALDEYLAGPAAVFRQKVQDQFRAGEVTFARAQAAYLGGFGGRERRHFT